MPFPPWTDRSLAWITATGQVSMPGGLRLGQLCGMGCPLFTAASSAIGTTNLTKRLLRGRKHQFATFCSRPKRKYGLLKCVAESGHSGYAAWPNSVKSQKAGDAQQF